MVNAKPMAKLQHTVRHGISVAWHWGRAVADNWGNGLQSFGEAVQGQFKAIDEFAYGWLARLLALAVVAFVVRLPLMSQSLWYDEAFTLWLAQMDFGPMMKAIKGDVHPPFFYIVEWLTVHLWGSTALRWPSMLFGVAAVWLVHLIFNRFDLPRRVNVTSQALVIGSPFLIYYSTEARMYSLLLALILLAVWAGQQQRPWLFGLACGLGLWTHNLMWLYLPGLYLAYMFYTHSFEAYWRDGRIIFWTILIIYLPWLPSLISQIQTINSGYWISELTPGRLIYLITQLVLHNRWLNEPILISFVFIIFILLWLGFRQVLRARLWPVFVLVTYPLLCGICLSILFQPVLIDRVLIGVVPFLLLIIAWGCLDVYNEIGAKLTLSTAGIAALTMFIHLYGVSLRPDYATAYAAIDVQPGQTCYHTSPGSHVLAAAYVPYCEHVTWPGHKPKPNGLSEATITAMGLQLGPVAEADYIFFTREPFTDPAETVYLSQLKQLRPVQSQTIYQTEFVHSQVWRMHD